MGNSDAECLVHRVRHPVLDGQALALQELLEAPDAGVLVPRSQGKGVEMVDAIGYAEPVHERFEADAARYDEDRWAISEMLKHAAQPAQELLDPLYVIVMGQHALEEDRQLIDGQEHWLVLSCAVAEQLLPITPPASGVQPGADFDSKIECADLLGLVAEPASHRGGETRRDQAN